MSGIGEKMPLAPQKGYLSEWKFDYLVGNIDPQIVRTIAQMDDEALKITLAGLICKLVGGLKSMPTRAHRVNVAKIMIARGAERERVRELTKISNSTYFKFKKEIHNGEK